MNEVLPLIDNKKFFLLSFDSSSLIEFLTEFSPSCISKIYDESSAYGVCFGVYERRQPNGNFSSDGKLNIVEDVSWFNYDNHEAYNVYGLKIYLTTSNIEHKVWERISRQISSELREENKAWESFKERISEIAERRRLSTKIISNELNRTNEMSQKLKNMIENKLRLCKELVKMQWDPTEMELKKDCVCLELKKDSNGKMYFDYQKYENCRPRENGDDNKWKIYLKEEYRKRDKTHVIYFEKSDKVEEKDENSAILISDNKNKIENSIPGKNENSNIANENQKDTQRSKSGTSNNRNSLNEIEYEQQNMKEDKDDNNKNGDINNQQRESNKGSELEIKYKNKSEIKYENPNNKQVTKPQPKPTVRYIILAVIFSPTVIFLIIFSYLAFKSYQFNCELKKNALQTLRNNRQKNPEVNQNKNRQQQIPAINIDYELDKQNNLEQKEI